MALAFAGPVRRPSLPLGGGGAGPPAAGGPRAVAPAPSGAGGGRRRGVWASLVVGGLVLGGLLLVSISGAEARGLGPGAGQGEGWAVVIDAGSSGSRAHVYHYEKVPGKLLPQVRLPEKTLKVKPGLSSFKDDPAGAGPALEGLMDFAKREIPEPQWKDTRVFLMATAGLRLLAPAAQTAIIRSCAEQIRASPFLFKDAWAGVLPGHKEGIFGWVAANYAMGPLQQVSAKRFAKIGATTGVIEMGGASAQVTFLRPANYSGDTRLIALGGLEVEVFTHSFLGFGQEAAQKKARAAAARQSGASDPCLPVGYSAGGAQGTGNFAGCLALARGILKPKNCHQSRCAIGDVYVPRLGGEFLATENFFYSAQFFDLPPSPTLAQIRAAGEQYCSQDWAALQAGHAGKSEEELLKYCFSAAYMYAFMHDGLEVEAGGALDGGIAYSNEVTYNGVTSDVDWPLGALLVDVLGEDGLAKGAMVNTVIAGLLVAVVLVAALVIVCTGNRQGFGTRIGRMQAHWGLAKGPAPPFHVGRPRYAKV